QAQQATDLGEARRARRKAAEALDRAALEAEKTAKQQEGDGGTRRGTAPADPSQQAGSSLHKAKSDMQNAQGQLGQGQTDQAQGPMRQAADAWQQAAKQLWGGQQAGGPPGDNVKPGNGPTSPPPAGELKRELSKYTGKAWGDLPGELRTRILQQAKA